MLAQDSPSEELQSHTLHISTQNATHRLNRRECKISADFQFTLYPAQFIFWEHLQSAVFHGIENKILNTTRRTAESYCVNHYETLTGILSGYLFLILTDSWHLLSVKTKTYLRDAKY